MELIAEERVLIHQMLRRGDISDETRRRIERDLDLEEAGFRSRTGAEGGEDLPL
jgi:CPA1 family monovalent cation:H+ antiporter